MHQMHSMLHAVTFIVVGTAIVFTLGQLSAHGQSTLSGFWSRGHVRRFARWGWVRLTTLPTTANETAATPATEPVHLEQVSEADATEEPTPAEPVEYEAILAGPEDVAPATPTDPQADLRRAKEVYCQLMAADPNCSGGHAYVGEIVERAHVDVETAFMAIDMASS